MLGPKNQKGSPNMKEGSFPKEHSKKCWTAVTRNLRKPKLASKVVNPFTRALEPPFYRETKGLLHSEVPSNLGNIPSVNMYMNVFHIP
jgi:hypothetical protein